MKQKIFTFGDDIAFVRGTAVPDRHWNGSAYVSVSFDDFDHLLTQLSKAAETDSELEPVIEELTEQLHDAQRVGHTEVVLGGGWIIAEHHHVVCPCARGCRDCRWTGVAHDEQGAIPDDDHARVRAYLATSTSS
jgi:hypothetical protein